MTDTEKKDVLRDYYLEGKEGNLTPDHLKDLSKRFGLSKEKELAKEIINRSADFMAKGVLDSYKNSTYAYENPYKEGKKS